MRYLLLLMLTFLVSTLNVEGQTTIVADTGSLNSKASLFFAGCPVSQLEDGRFVVQGGIINDQPSRSFINLLDGTGRLIPYFKDTAIINRGFFNNVKILSGPDKSIFISYQDPTNPFYRITERLDSMGRLAQPAFKVRIQSSGYESGLLLHGKMLMFHQGDSLAGRYSPVWGLVNLDGSLDTTFQNRFTLPSNQSLRIGAGPLTVFSDGGFVVGLSNLGQNILYDGQPISDQQQLLFLNADGSLRKILPYTNCAGSFGDYVYIRETDGAPNATYNLRRVFSDGTTDSSFWIGFGQPYFLGGTIWPEICGFWSNGSFLVRYHGSAYVSSSPPLRSDDYNYLCFSQDGVVDSTFSIPENLGFVKNLWQTGANQVLINFEPPIGADRPTTSLLCLDTNLTQTSTQATRYTLHKPGRLCADPAGNYYLMGGDVIHNGSVYPTVQRYNPDGRLDTSFRLRSDIRFVNRGRYLNQDAKSILVRHNGRLILYGWFRYLRNGKAYEGCVGLLPSGHLDTSFTPPQFGKLDESNTTQINRIVEDSAGYLYISGFYNILNPIRSRSASRLLPDGSLDTSFGGVRTSYPVLSLPHGRLLAIGKTDTLIFCQNSDGTRNNAFTILKWPGSNASLTKLISGPNGEVYVIGSINWQGHRLPAIRLKPTSFQIDTTWLSNLSQTFIDSLIPFSNPETAIALSNGNLVILRPIYYSQSTYSFQPNPFVVVSPEGRMQTLPYSTTFGIISFASDLVQQPDGLLVSGSFTYANPTYPYTVSPNSSILKFRYDLFTNHTALASHSLILFPNPAHTLLTIQGPAGSFTTTLQDLTGHTVRTGNSPTLNLHGLAPGLYVLKVDGYTPTRVVVE